jgi:integrase
LYFERCLFLLTYSSKSSLKKYLRPFALPLANPSFEQGITIYSFRHSGAIEIFKRTGSLTKLKKAMGHSSLNVSLTYLRGLEVAKLKEEDMPMV